MTKKALTLALEALEEIALAGMSGTGQESKELMIEWHARQAWKFIGIAARALKPIKEALQSNEQVEPDLAELEKAMIEIWQPVNTHVTFEDFNAWMQYNLPVGTVIGNPDWWSDKIYNRFIKNTHPPVPTAQPEQEPVAAQCKFDTEESWGWCSIEHHKLVQSEPHKWPDYQTRLLYAAPPQRKPLTYVDLRRIANQCGLGANEVSARTHATIDNFARAIEAAHGIKENT